MTIASTLIERTPLFGRMFAVDKSTGLEEINAWPALMIMASFVWLAVAGSWLSLLVARGWLPASARGGGYQSLIFGFGVLLYLLSLAVGYLLVMFEDSRAADRRTLQVQVLARDAELRAKWQQQLRYLLVDEVLETNAAQ